MVTVLFFPRILASLSSSGTRCLELTLRLCGMQRVLTFVEGREPVWAHLEMPTVN